MIITRTTVRKFFAGIKFGIRRFNRIDPNIMGFIIYGLLYDIVINIYKPFAVKFLERLGGGDFYISLYNSLPGLVAIFALIPGSIFISRFKSKKNVSSAFFIASRLLVLCLAFIPAFDKKLQPLVFVVIVGIMNFPDSISQMALQSFLGENMEGAARAEAISLRTQFGQITTLIVTLITGLIIRFTAKTPEQAIFVYQIFFVSAFIISVFEITAFRRMKEKPRREEASKAKKPSAKEIVSVFKNTKYRNFLVPTIFFYFTWQLAWPAISAYQVLALQADEIWFAAFSVASGISAYFGAAFWGKKVKKHGNDKILIIAILCLAGNMVGYALSSSLWMIVLVNIYGGFVGTSITITLFNGLLEATPDKNRVIYIAVYNTLVNLSLAVSPFASYLLMSVMSYRLVFIIDGVLRACAGLIIYLGYRKRAAIKSPA